MSIPATPRGEKPQISTEQKEAEKESALLKFARSLLPDKRDIEFTQMFFGIDEVKKRANPFEQGISVGQRFIRPGKAMGIIAMNTFLHTCEGYTKGAKLLWKDLVAKKRGPEGAAPGGKEKGQEVVKPPAAKVERPEVSLTLQKEALYIIWHGSSGHLKRLHDLFQQRQKASNVPMEGLTEAETFVVEQIRKKLSFLDEAQQKELNPLLKKYLDDPSEENYHAFRAACDKLRDKLELTPAVAKASPAASIPKVSNEFEAMVQDNGHAVAKEILSLAKQGFFSETEAREMFSSYTENYGRYHRLALSDAANAHLGHFKRILGNPGPNTDKSRALDQLEEVLHKQKRL